MAATGLNPEGLLQAAEHLMPEGRGRPSPARLRRAISTAYYAAFAALTQEIAHHFPSTEAQHAVRRLASHGSARTVCRNLRASGTVPWLFGKPACHEDLLQFAEDFDALYTRRILADYDHSYLCTKRDATDAVSLAHRAVASLESARQQCPEQLDMACIATIADERSRRHLLKPRVG
ncbi:MAG: hypothetical protein OXG55_10450 [bacterium]|nr:hypothetical protein [bacterium]MCY4103661.1 hypothetical protein [bacterium]